MTRSSGAWKVASWATMARASAAGPRWPSPASTSADRGRTPAARSRSAGPARPSTRPGTGAARRRSPAPGRRSGRSTGATSGGGQRLRCRRRPGPRRSPRRAARRSHTRAPIASAHRASGSGWRWRSAVALIGDHRADPPPRAGQVAQVVAAGLQQLGLARPAGAAPVRDQHAERGQPEDCRRRRTCTAPAPSRPPNIIAVADRAGQHRQHGEPLLPPRPGRLRDRRRRLQRQLALGQRWRGPAGRPRDDLRSHDARSIVTGDDPWGHGASRVPLYRARRLQGAACMPSTER